MRWPPATASLGQSISGLDQTLQVAPASLSAVDHSLPPLVNLATALDPSLKVSPPIIDKLTGDVHELATVLAPAERSALLTSLRATFQQFPTILHDLAVVFPITKQVTDCLQNHVLPVLTSTVPDGSLSTGEPVWKDFLHFLPGVAGASGTFDGNGPCDADAAGGRHELAERRDPRQDPAPRAVGRRGAGRQHLARRCPARLGRGSDALRLPSRRQVRHAEGAEPRSAGGRPATCARGARRRPLSARSREPRPQIAQLSKPRTVR